MDRFKRLLKITAGSLLFMYRIARGLDHKILNKYIIKINQMNDIDGIIYQASRCLYYILDYQLFAFAVYDREYNGSVDIWVDPKIDNMAAANLIKKDFPSQNLYYNIRCLNNRSKKNNSAISNNCLKNTLSYKIIDSQTRAILYLMPRRMILNYHSELLDIILKTIGAAISNLINLQKLENAALIDPLTHCYNRRALNKHIEHDLAKTKRYGSDLSAIMYDIDHFKKINDTYGHKAGDTVLQAISKVVLSVIRKGDYLARYGGEEFMLILPETRFAKAIELAERLRKIIENLKINIGDKVINITASFGITVHKKGADINQLFQKADEMLYVSKTRGRNRITPDFKLYNNFSEKGQPVFKKESFLH